MITPDEINRIKQHVAIADVLASRGIQPVSQNYYELAYCSPLRGDSHPSFYVNLQSNVFKDMAVDAHRGDVIRLVQLLDGVSFATAVGTLQDFEGLPDRPRFFLSGPMVQSPTGKDNIREVKYVQNPALLRYVESRGIHVALARTYLREVHYRHHDRYLYALGFANDREGYALRNGVGCKRNIGPNAITTISGTRPDSGQVNVFEGFFDFLSALQYYNRSVPTHRTYVLNSVSNLHHIVPHLSQSSRINVYFDRDKAGRDAFGTLKQADLPVFDQSGLYRGHIDFNEFLIAGLPVPGYGPADSGRTSIAD